MQRCQLSFLRHEFRELAQNEKAESGSTLKDMRGMRGMETYFKARRRDTNSPDERGLFWPQKGTEDAKIEN
jgi:hypothetical protein